MTFLSLPVRKPLEARAPAPRRTSKLPISRLRGTIIVSIASHEKRSPGVGSLAGCQLAGAACKGFAAYAIACSLLGPQLVRSPLKPFTRKRKCLSITWQKLM